MAPAVLSINQYFQWETTNGFPPGWVPFFSCPTPVFMSRQWQIRLQPRWHGGISTQLDLPRNHSCGQGNDRHASPWHTGNVKLSCFPQFKGFGGFFFSNSNTHGGFVPCRHFSRDLLSPSIFILILLIISNYFDSPNRKDYPNIRQNKYILFFYFVLCLDVT